jgi:hypothetical protein
MNFSFSIIIASFENLILSKVVADCLLDILLPKSPQGQSQVTGICGLSNTRGKSWKTF